MKNSTMTTYYTASNCSDTKMTRMKSGIKIIVTSALLLAASSAMAGIIYLPVGGRYQAPETAPVSIQNLGGESFRINTTGLIGELTIQGSDFPPDYDIGTTDNVVLPFEQELELFINLSSGVVEGRASILTNNENMFVIAGHTDSSGRILIRLDAEVQGNATCLPLNGLDCGQLVVDLELRGVVSDPNDPAIIGQLRMNVLASLYFDGNDVGLGSWAAMSANTTIGGNEGLINSLTSMGESEGVQVTPWTDGQ